VLAVKRGKLRWQGGRLVIEIPAIIRIPVELEAFAQHAQDAITLTPREKQVLEGILRQQQNKEIAASVGICERTVKYHVSALLLKFGVKGRGELIEKLAGPRSRAVLAEDASGKS